MEEEVAQNHRLLKGIVITLGVLIVVMLALMVGTVIWRMKHAPEPPPPAPVSTDLAVPPGSTVLGMTPTERELYLRLRDGEGHDHIYVLDRRNGDLLWHRRLLPSR
jgi:hypothetical protein